MIALLISGVGLHVELRSSDQFLALSVGTNPVGPLLLPREVNQTVAGIYSSMENLNAPEQNWANQTSVDTAIWNLYTGLNQSSMFDSLVETLGSGSFHFTARYLIASGIADVTFGVAWTSGENSSARLNYDY
jgi:hypothetical protein